MTPHERVQERWPHVHAGLSRLPHSPHLRVEGQGNRQRLMMGRHSLVGVDPRRDAMRWVDKVLADLGGEEAPPRRLHVMGHGLGWELASLLERGVGKIFLHLTDPALFRFLLDHWECPEILSDPRLEVVMEQRDCIGLGQPGDAVVEWPMARRHHAEEICARRAVLGLLRSSRMRLRVLVVEPLYGGSLPMARSAAQALRELGHEVRSLEVEGMAGAREALQCFADRHPGASALAAEFTRLLGRMLLVEARSFKPDLVLGLAQSPFTPEVAQELRRAGVRSAFWFVEDWESLDYWRGLHGHFDLFLPIQRHPFTQALAEHSSAPVRYLPTCADPATCHSEPWEEGERPKLSFVGAGYHNRERVFLQLLDLPLRIWGSDWRPGGPLAKRLEKGGSRTTALDNRRIFSNSLVNLNLHSSSYHDGIRQDGDFVNPRTFEILACGGFQLVDQRSLMKGMLEPGRDLACYASVEELRQSILHHLAHEEERRWMAQQGRQTVLSLHTYRHRMAQLLEYFLLEQEDAFPHALPRHSLEEDWEDPELKAWLAGLPAHSPRDLDGLAAWLKRGGARLEGPALTVLYMHELREWARGKGVDQLFEQARHG